jgi:F0F1-type ATP synthase membrane subunit b/b'
MIAFFVILAFILFGLFMAAFFKSRQLEALVAQRDGEVAAAKQESESARQRYESETQRTYGEAQAAVADAQRQIDQQLSEMKQESERIRQHYETEARRIQDTADALVSKTTKEFEPLKKYEGLRDAEAEVQRQLAAAMKEANGLLAEAHALLEQSRSVAADERARAIQRAKEIREQADALLNQATLDAGRIFKEANKRAEQIAGDAYTALRDKQLLERAAEAMRNVIDGYGDRYIIPTRSLLDELAIEFGYTAAGEALKSARDLSRRMVEQGEAATCDYVEANRRETAIQFVIVAFNGRVDAILSRSKHDNYGTLEREIRDAYSLVNLNGSAFRKVVRRPAERPSVG